MISAAAPAATSATLQYRTRVTDIVTTLLRRRGQVIGRADDAPLLLREYSTRAPAVGRERYLRLVLEA
jgi:hypothetical protein